MKTSGRPCRKCGGNSRVIDVDVRIELTYRRRRCVDCGRRWTTRELDDDESEIPPTPIHADDTAQP